MFLCERCLSPTATWERQKLTEGMGVSVGLCEACEQQAPCVNAPPSAARSNMWVPLVCDRCGFRWKDGDAKVTTEMQAWRRRVFSGGGWNLGDGQMVVAANEGWMQIPMHPIAGAIDQVQVQTLCPTCGDAFQEAFSDWTAPGGHELEVVQYRNALTACVHHLFSAHAPTQEEIEVFKTYPFLLGLFGDSASEAHAKTVVQLNLLGQGWAWCTRCETSGKVSHRRCQVCWGTGMVQEPGDV